MAKCKVENRTVFVLELTEEEAAVAKFVMSSIGGDPFKSWRAVSDRILRALNESGAPEAALECRGDRRIFAG